MQKIGVIPESGEVLTHYRLFFVLFIICVTKQTRHVVRSKWVRWRTWVVIIICLTKQTRHVTGQCGYGVVPGCGSDPVSGYQMLSSYFYVSQVSRMVEYLGADHHMFNKTDTTCNMSMWVWCRTWVLCRPCKWVPDVVVIFLCIASITSNIY